MHQRVSHVYHGAFFGIIKKVKVTLFLSIERINLRNSAMRLCADASRRRESSWETLRMGEHYWCRERKRERDEGRKGKKKNGGGEREDYADESIGVTSFGMYVLLRCQSLENQFLESDWHFVYSWMITKFMFVLINYISLFRLYYYDLIIF